MNQFDREVDYLQAEYERGDIDDREYQDAMNDIAQEARWAAHEAAQRAYDEELERW